MMRGPIAILITAVLSVIVAVAVRLHGPAWAWWVDPLPLAILAGLAPLLAAVLTPATWWRR